MIENTDGDIGRILKERREQLGFTLQEAEEETRIRKIYLESLENNRFSELPGQAYVTGFIRVYARYLGLKSNSLLSLLSDLQSDETKPLETLQAVKRQPDLRVKSSPGGDWRKFFLVFILVLVLGGLLYLLPAIFSSDEPVKHSTTKGTETEENSVETDNSQTELEEPPSGPEKTQFIKTAQNIPDESGDVAAERVSVPSRADAIQQDPGNRILPAIPYDGASLRMLALADSSLIIKVDASKPDQYKLYDGLDLTWKIKQRVNVEFSASDVARFWLNGQEIDVAGYESFELQAAAE